MQICWQNIINCFFAFHYKTTVFYTWIASAKKEKTSSLYTKPKPIKVNWNIQYIEIPIFPVAYYYFIFSNKVYDEL